MVYSSIHCRAVLPECCLHTIVRVNDQDEKEHSFIGSADSRIGIIRQLRQQESGKHQSDRKSENDGTRNIGREGGSIRQLQCDRMTAAMRSNDSCDENA